ncbi:MAG: glycerol-3-phosphate acyltransferase [Anaerolineales bacterium]|jgi:glycerol-3-phosphate acyltransferase PlsY
MYATILETLGFSLLGYLLGSLPFAYWVTARVSNVDVRQVGSGHATSTNTIRQAGWAAGLLVFVLDVSKGFLATFLAVHFGHGVWLAPLAGALAVAGHCWPLLAGFQGGMGLATSAGAFLALSPLGFLLGFGMLVVLVLVLHHAARAGLLTGLLVGPLLWLLGFRGAIIWLAVLAGAVVVLRFAVDWRRQYRELWLDRGEKKP